MAVERTIVSACLECHSPDAEHYLNAPCTECHLPVAEASRLTLADIEAFPTPADHDAANFLLEHGDAASEAERCTVCHARELCSSCHVNAPELEPIRRMPSDSRVAALTAGREPEYPTPDSHRSVDWLEAHGQRASADISRCSTCHARDSCLSCHTSPLPAIRALPLAPDETGARGGPGAPREPEAAGVQERGRGVRLERRAPPSHTPGFLENHRALAAARTGQCETCHTQDECTSCHTGSEALVREGRETAGYHPRNFMQRHPAAAFGRQAECSTCHNPEAFCRDCHSSSGLGAQGRIDTGFHDESRAWVFGHGAAARQGLESCVTCHTQRDCLSCHSAAGGRRVNPHGPGFDPDRLRSKNPGLCLTCHFRSILE